MQHRLREIQPLCALFPGGAALTGLRVPHRLRAGSPDRRSAPPPGQPE
ncbi:hypothetical protein A225_1475 [Klebsiella michiganensis E718]|nr:hypothetical protein A225_1475 [Klebsiella michiganensis E718]